MYIVGVYMYMCICICIYVCVCAITLSCIIFTHFTVVCVRVRVCYSDSY